MLQGSTSLGSDVLSRNERQRRDGRDEGKEQVQGRRETKGGEERWGLIILADNASVRNTTARTACDAGVSRGEGRSNRGISETDQLWLYRCLIKLLHEIPQFFLVEEKGRGVGEEKGSGRGEGEERGGGGVGEEKGGVGEKDRRGQGKKSHDMTVYVHCSIT